MTYMLDTNICIYAIKHKPEQVFQHMQKNLQKGLCISAITLAELEHGIEKKGTPIGTMDMLIAGHAMIVDCILVTNNVREFERVPGLRIENWVE